MRFLHKKKIGWMAAALAFCICVTSVPASATTISDAQKKRDEAQKELDAINKQISSLQNQQSALASEILGLDSELDELVVNLEMLQNDLELKEEELEQAQEEYDAAVQREENQYESMKLRIQYIYEEGSLDYVSLLLETKSLSDFLTKVDYAQELHTQSEVLLDEYQQIKEEVAELKAQLEIEKADLETLQAEYEQEKNEVEARLNEKKAEEANFESLLANAQAKAKEYKDTINKQNAQIKKLQDEAKKKAAAANGGTTSGGSSSGSTSGGATVTGGSGRGREIANYALQFVGNPYVSGGTSLTNGADCSGFTWAVFQHFGISLPRTSAAQAGAGRAVSYSEAQPGDLICYPGHVAIYIGGGQIVHASTPATGIKTGSATYRSILTVRRCY